MDGRFNSEMTAAGYGFYSYSAEDEFRLTGDCHDLAALIGKTAEEVEGQPLASLIACSDREITVGKLQDQLNSTGETEALIRFVGEDGVSRCVLSRGKLERDSFGNAYVRNVFLLAENTGKMIAELQNTVESCRIKLSQNEKRMDFLQTCAWQDSLTGILNAGATRTLSEEYISGKKNACAMFIIDMDDFKSINDLYGHMVGNNVLICIANAIKKLFRSNDIVGRIGGDEFLVLMKDVSDKEIISVRCTQIIAAINEIQCDSVKRELMAVSVGAAVTGGAVTHYDEMFHTADKAMYRAKRSGGNRYVIGENA